MTIEKKALEAYKTRRGKLLAKVRPAVDMVWDYIEENDLDPEEALAEYLPAVADRYGKAMAVMAADYFAASRIAAHAAGSYEASTSTGALWKIGRDVTYALGDDFAYESPRDFLVSSVSSVVQDYGRQTMVDNSARDSTCEGYVSIPGANPCVFCMMKALDSYRNFNGEKLEVEIDGDAWHDNCDCTLQPLWDDSPTFVEERMDEFRQVYDDGMKYAIEQKGGDMTTNMKATEVMAGMRAVSGIEH